MDRSTDSRRARNSDSVTIGGRRRPVSRPSRRRCFLASSRVDPLIARTSLLLDPDWLPFGSRTCTTVSGGSSELGESEPSAEPRRRLRRRLRPLTLWSSSAEPSASPSASPSSSGAAAAVSASAFAEPSASAPSSLAPLRDRRLRDRGRLPSPWAPWVPVSPASASGSSADASGDEDSGWLSPASAAASSPLRPRPRLDRRRRRRPAPVPSSSSPKPSPSPSLAPSLALSLDPSLASLAPFLVPPADAADEPDAGAWLSARGGATGSGRDVGGWNSTGAGGWNSAAGTTGATGAAGLGRFRSPTLGPPGELSVDAPSAGALALEVLSFDSLS